MFLNENPTMYNVLVNGSVVARNLPSHMIAENVVASLTTEQRAVAQIVPVTVSGQQILFG